MTGADRGDLELIAGGRRLRFPAVWLRDNCPCAQCTDPRSGQKFSAITDLPDGLAVAAAEDAGESVVVTYAPDRHRSVFSRAWLTGHALDGHGDGDGRTEDDKVLWLAADLRGHAARRGRGSGAPLGRPGQGPRGHTAAVFALRGATWRPRGGLMAERCGTGH